MKSSFNQNFYNIYRREFSMIQASFVIMILLSLFGQNYAQDLLNETPSDWIDNCSANNGSRSITKDQDSVVAITNEYIFLKSSKIYIQLSLDNSYQLRQNMFKHYIQISETEGTQTDLQISLIFGINGSKITQTYIIQNKYEFIDADGPFCLLKETNADGIVQLTLYSFDQTPLAKNLLQLTATNLDTYPDQTFKSVKVGYVYNFVYERYYIDGRIISINAQTSETIVRQLFLQTGIGEQIYRFVMKNINSDFYDNILLAVQISCSSLYIYPCPSRDSGDPPPFVYSNNQAAIQSSSGLFSNHIVISFQPDILIATYDDNGQNGNIFFLQTEWFTYSLSLTNLKTTLSSSTILFNILLTTNLILLSSIEILQSVLFIQFGHIMNIFNTLHFQTHLETTKMIKLWKISQTQIKQQVQLFMSRFMMQILRVVKYIFGLLKGPPLLSMQCQLYMMKIGMQYILQSIKNMLYNLLETYQKIKQVNFKYKSPSNAWEQTLKQWTCFVSPLTIHAFSQFSKFHFEQPLIVNTLMIYY